MRSGWRAVVRLVETVAWTGSERAGGMGRKCNLDRRVERWKREKSAIDVMDADQVCAVWTWHGHPARGIWRVACPPRWRAVGHPCLATLCAVHGQIRLGENACSPNVGGALRPDW